MTQCGLSKACSSIAVSPQMSPYHLLNKSKMEGLVKHKQSLSHMKFFLLSHTQIIENKLIYLEDLK